MSWSTGGAVLGFCSQEGLDLGCGGSVRGEEWTGCTLLFMGLVLSKP